jgi:hypothetical protein
LDYSEKQFSIEAQLAKGLPLPEWVEREPPIYPGDDFILTAFYNLSSCRHYGGEIPGPIPWDRVVYYAMFAGLDKENIELLVFILRELDAAYLSWYAKRVKQKTKTPVLNKRRKTHDRL